jgi:hypothetical protein
MHSCSESFVRRLGPAHRLRSPEDETWESTRDLGRCGALEQDLGNDQLIGAPRGLAPGKRPPVLLELAEQLFV